MSKHREREIERERNDVEGQRPPLTMRQAEKYKYRTTRGTETDRRHIEQRHRD
jgi:hypothetical protein